jgi:hypothetical protein
VGVEWAFVAAGLVVLTAGVLGFLAARPATTLEHDRRLLAEERAASLSAALEHLAEEQRLRRNGAQADADHDHAIREALGSAPPGDVLGAALAVVRLAKAREAARARPAATGEAKPPAVLGPGGSLDS